MRYTIEELRSYRELYKEPIYSGFSLEALLDCRKDFGVTHSRSENAYSIRIPKTERDRYSRIVRRELNKLTESNYEVILKSLQDPQLLLTQDYRSVLVDILHQKALLEPECSHNYAAMCRDLAAYETNYNVKGKENPKSLFRTDLLTKIRGEFQRTLEEPTAAEEAAAYGVKPENSAEENAMLLEEGRSAHLRKKLANIRFIGQLYLHDVLTTKTMTIVLNQILLDRKNIKPSEENIEAVAVLLTTIGLRLTTDNSVLVNSCLSRLNQINDRYRTRIKYMIMDLCDLQKNGWRKREERAASPTAKPGAKTHGGATSASSSKNLPSSPNRFGGGPYPASSSSGVGSWRGAAVTASSSKKTTSEQNTVTKKNKGSAVKPESTKNTTTSFTKAAAGTAGKAKGGAFATVTHTSTMQREDEDDEENEMEEEEDGEQTARVNATIHLTDAAKRGLLAGSTLGTVVPKSPVMTPSIQPFRTLVRATMTDWVERLNNEFIHQWTDAFAYCDRKFGSIPELGEAVAAEVVSLACMTTRPTAQEEAASFLSVALDLSDAEILGGFATALAVAIEENLIEDCPKFPERWMRVLGLISELQTDLYFDLGSICRNAFQNKLSITVTSDSSNRSGNGEEGEVTESTIPSSADTEDHDGVDDFVEDELSSVMDVMRSFWVYLPTPAGEDSLFVRALIALIDDVNGEPKEGLDKVLAAYMYHLFRLGVYPAESLEVLQQYESASQPPLFKQVVDELQRAIYPPA